MTRCTQNQNVIQNIPEVFINEEYILFVEPLMEFHTYLSTPVACSNSSASTPVTIPAVETGEAQNLAANSFAAFEPIDPCQIQPKR